MYNYHISCENPECRISCCAIALKRAEAYEIWNGRAAPMQKTLADVEREHIISVLDGTGWKRGESASILGIDNSTLYRKLVSYGIKMREQMV